LQMNPISVTAVDESSHEMSDVIHVFSLKKYSPQLQWFQASQYE
jgi:hypothetical protein